MMKSRGLLGSAFVTVALGRVIAGCGGQTDDPPGVDRATAIHDLCSRAVACSGGEIPDCEQDLTEQAEEAVAAGCGQELDAFLECFTGPATSCEDGKIDNPACESKVEAAKSCLDGYDPPPDLDAECGVSFGAGPDGSQCSVQCKTYKATCYTSSVGGYTCVCEAGPNVGLTFSTPDCNHFGTAEASVCS